MAAPSYTEDLTDIDLAEAASTGWTAFNISGGGGGAPAFGADLGMQGAGCWDKPCSNAERGLAVNKTPGAGVVAAGVHIFTWGFCATPGITDSLFNRGAYIIIGTSTTNFMQFHVEGNDTYGAAGRVGKCYAVDYVTTASAGSRTVNGTPGATPTYFGYGLKTTATAKGSNMGCDAIRYGTGAYITAGDITTPATFLGFQTQSDAIANRWGILTDVGGSYELQGRFVVGQDNTKTPTAAYFDDSSGITILIVDTPHAATDFTQIIVDHASTTFNLTGATIKDLGDNNLTELIFNNDSTTATLDGNVFDGMWHHTLRAGVTAIGNTWKGCGYIRLNGATITGGVIRDGDHTAALFVDTASEMAAVTGVSFIDNLNGGTAGHSIELTSTGVHTFTDLTFSGGGGTPGSNLVASSGSASADVYNNSGGAITINVAGGDLPSVRNAAGSTTTVVATVTLTITDVPSGVQCTIVNSSTRAELQNSTSTGADITYSHEGGETVDILFMANDYDPNAGDVYDLTLPTANSSIKANIPDDINYENP